MIIANRLVPVEAGFAAAEVLRWILRTFGRRVGYAQLRTLSGWRDRGRILASYVCPDPLLAIARKIRCGIGSRVDAKTR
jgi:hypothetical protein